MTMVAAASAPAGGQELDTLHFVHAARIPPMTRRERNSGIAWALRHLPLPLHGRALVVGAARGVDAIVQHLSEIRPLRIDVVEADPASCESLRGQFGDGIQLVPGKLAEYPWPDEALDIIVHDASSGRVPLVLGRTAPLLARHVAPGGIIMLHCIYDIGAAYDGEEPFYDPTTRKANEEFAETFFGATTVTVAAAEAAFAPHNLRVCGIVDRFLGAHPKGRAVGWLVLQKLAPA